MLMYIDMHLGKLEEQLKSAFMAANMI